VTTPTDSSITLRRLLSQPLIFIESFLDREVHKLKRIYRHGFMPEILNPKYIATDNNTRAGTRN
jgi:hypothetical protein